MVSQKENRLRKEKFNNQGCLMKIIEYSGSNNMIVEFQDKYKTKVHCAWKEFSNGKVKNPYYPEVYGVGIVGDKYPTWVGDHHTKEYTAWRHMLARCYDKKTKEKQRTYKDVVCCEDWLFYEGFYEWIHSQENFWKWLDGDRWCLDKDIIKKGNKFYSPDNCCLVPNNVNILFTTRKNDRGKFPIGVSYSTGKFVATCNNPFTKKSERIGTYNTVEEAFQAYKIRKELFIKQVAEIEYVQCNITKECYEAMMKYEVEITD